MFFLSATLAFHRQVDTQRYEAMLRYIDTSKTVLRKAVKIEIISSSATSLYGRYRLVDSSEPYLLSRFFTNRVALHLFGVNLSDTSLRKDARDSMAKFIRRRMSELALTRRTPVTVNAGGAHPSDTSFIVFLSPIISNVAIAAIFPFPQGRVIQGYDDVIRFNRAVLVFFEFDENGNITDSETSEVHYD